MSNIEKVKKKKPITKKPKHSLQRRLLNSELKKDLSSDSLSKFSLHESGSINTPMKQKNQNYLLSIPIKEDNYNTIKSNRDFEQLEMKINNDITPENLDKLKLSYLNNSKVNNSIQTSISKKKQDNEELPVKLRVSRTEFEPSSRKNFVSTKKKEFEETIDQSEALGKEILLINLKIKF
jgi:outer membrane PBP1 activator LpoA protein